MNTATEEPPHLSVSMLSVVKAISLLFITIYLIYVQSVSSSSNNWQNSRLIGFSNDGYCNRNDKTYSVEEVYIQDPNDLSDRKPIPFAVQIDSIGSGFSLCMEPTTVESCMPLFKDFPDMTVHAFNEMFDNASRSYFPFLILMIILSAAGMVLTGLYDFDTNEQTTIGNFSSHLDKALMIKVNTLACIGLVCLMTASGGSFILIKDEDCSLLYDPGDEIPLLCRRLKQCSGSLSSVIVPSDDIVSHYTLVLTVTSVILSASILLRCAVNIGMFDCLPCSLPQLRVINYWGGSTTRATGTTAARVRQRRRGNTAGQDDEDERDLDRIKASWKVLDRNLIDKTHGKYHQDCAICLLSLFHDDNDSDASKEDIDQDSSRQRITIKNDSNDYQQIPVDSNTSATAALTTTDVDNTMTDEEAGISLQSLQHLHNSNSNNSTNPAIIETRVNQSTSTSTADESAQPIQSEQRRRPRVSTMPSLTDYVRAFRAGRIITRVQPANLSNTGGQHQELDPASVVVVQCGHVFHQQCMTDWVTSARHVVCPVCRFDLSVAQANNTADSVNTTTAANDLSNDSHHTNDVPLRNSPSRSSRR